MDKLIDYLLYSKDKFATGIRTAYLLQKNKYKQLDLNTKPISFTKNENSAFPLKIPLNKNRIDKSSSIFKKLTKKSSKLNRKILNANKRDFKSRNFHSNTQVNISKTSTRRFCKKENTSKRSRVIIEHERNDASVRIEQIVNKKVWPILKKLKWTWKIRNTRLSSQWVWYRPGKGIRGGKNDIPREDYFTSYNELLSYLEKNQPEIYNIVEVNFESKSAFPVETSHTSKINISPEVATDMMNNNNKLKIINKQKKANQSAVKLKRSKNKKTVTSSIFLFDSEASLQSDSQSKRQKRVNASGDFISKSSLNLRNRSRDNANLSISAFSKHFRKLKNIYSWQRFTNKMMRSGYHAGGGFVYFAPHIKCFDDGIPGVNIWDNECDAVLHYLKFSGKKLQDLENMSDNKMISSEEFLYNMKHNHQNINTEDKEFNDLVKALEKSCEPYNDEFNKIEEKTEDKNKNYNIDTSSSSSTYLKSNDLEIYSRR